MGGQGDKGMSLEEYRNQIMYNLFGDESEEVEDPENSGDEVTSMNGNNKGAGDEANLNINCSLHLPAPAARKHAYKSDSRCHHRLEEGHAESQGSAGLAKERVGEAHHVVLGYQNVPGNVEVMNSEEEGYCQRIETSRIRVITSEFVGSKDNYNADEDRKDNEVNRKRKSGPTEDDKAHGVLSNVFYESDEDEIATYGGQDAENDNISPTEDEGHTGNILQGKDIVPGNTTCYESDANVERESKQCPVGPSLNLVVPHIPPPGQPDRMNVIRVSNVVGIDPKPFNPETYAEEDAFNTDESEGKKRIHLNVVRWRMVKNADGTVSAESNARFVKWKDGSMQLLIGDEALDVTVDETSHDTHLFMKNGKGLLQSQGRLLQKMRFMPSSLSSRSHRSLTALVDSQNKKTIKVQTWYDKTDPERAKQEMERAAEKDIRARSILRQKREKLNRKYTQPHRQKQKLTPGFLEEPLHQNEAPGFKYNRHGRVPHSGFEHDSELEAPSERRMFNAKVNEYSDSEREELEYETELEDVESSPTHGSENELDERNGYDQDLEEALGFTSVSDEDIEEQEPKRREPRKRGKVIDSDDESPPPRKQPLNRGKASVFYSDDDE
uniref:Uncharacterized protein n=1 Tax=Avena sativa TaxID=4498 RepID=A0ACD6A9C0_AVESA